MKKIRKYFSFFRIRFNAGLQYRAAAMAGILTQLAWGLLTILLYKVFYDGDPGSFPMEMQEVSAYIWLRQAFLSLFNTWTFDQDIFTAITNGNVAYELARPLDLYHMWYVKNLSIRISNASLRFLPVLIIAAIVPPPYGMPLPPNIGALLGFICTMLLGVLVTCAFLMIVYAVTFYTMQPQGVRIIFVSLSEFFCGDLIPLPFFPDNLTRALALTPFASMSNVPFRVYSGNIAGLQIVQCIGLQIFWLIVLSFIGRLMIGHASKRAVFQGG